MSGGQPLTGDENAGRPQSGQAASRVKGQPSAPFDPARGRRIEELVQKALDLAVDQQLAYVRRQCGEDAALRAEVEELLGVSEAHLGRFLEEAPLEAPAASPEPRPADLPQTIGHFTILRKIGEGGMGVVYEARQENPHRTVALKLMRPGALSSSLRRRFQYEADVLAQLQHPGIAQIFEAGVAELAGVDQSTPCPYFAMELIDGRRLQEYAAAGLDVRAKLELVARICDAVQHAHQKGVIHRDLKPANVLVDESGQPKVVDFGVARATDGDVQITTMRTDVGQLIGTLSYMSPEQVSGDSRQVDTRSDVYGLGVILYEMLAGRLPIEIHGVSIADAARLIREKEPVRLSLIQPLFRGDIETIVAKALEKEKDRRYGSAAQLAADIRHFLRDEPVVARPTSALYQLRKFARRNRVLVAGVAGVMLALLIGVMGTAYGLIEARRERDLALDARQTAERRRIESDANAARAAKVVAYIQGMLRSADPAQSSRGADYTVQQMLDDVSMDLGAQFAGEPEVEAAVRTTIGLGFLNLGQFDKAEPHLRAALTLRQNALGPEHLEIADTLTGLGLLDQARGDFAAAERRHRAALDMRRKLLGDAHAVVANSLNNVALCLHTRGDYIAAEPLYRQALGIFRGLRVSAPADPEVANTLNNLAGLLHDRGDYEDAEALHREALAILRELHPEGHAAVADSLNNLALSLHGQGDHAAAEPLYREALAMRRKFLGEAHPIVSVSLGNLARLLFDKHDYAAAEPLFREALAVGRAALGDDHPSVATIRCNWAGLLNAVGDHAEAEEHLRAALAVTSERLGAEHPAVAMILYELATTRMHQHDYAGAEALYRQALSMVRQSLGPDHLEAAVVLHNLANCIGAAGDHASAEPLLREALEIRLKRLPAEHPLVARSRGNLGVCLTALGRYEEAEGELLRGFGDMQHDAEVHPVERNLVERLIELYDAWHAADPDKGNDAEAAAWRARLETDVPP